MPSGGSDLEFVDNTNIKIFPKSLVSYSVDLQYYCGVVGPGTGANSRLTPAGDPHVPDTSWNYSAVQNGDVFMVSAEKASIETSVGLAGNNNKLGVVRSGNESHFGYGISGANNYQFLPYGTYLATIKAEKEYMIDDRFPLFKEKYPTISNNNVFALVVNIAGGNANAANTNPFVPYRVYRTTSPGSLVEIEWSESEASPGIAVEFNGIIKFKFIRAASGL